MKYYIITITDHDNGHEYSSQSLVSASNQEVANRKGEKIAQRNWVNDDEDELPERDKYGYYTSPDGSVMTSFSYAVEIPKEHYEFLKQHSYLHES